MKNTHIQWTDNTFNPWEGCTKVSPGCANCYAETRNSRFNGGTAINWGKGAPRRRTSLANWNEPKRWNRAAMADEDSLLAEKPRRPRVFCASLADWLDDEVPIEWLADLLILIFDCGFLDWQLLSKRLQNFERRLRAAAAFIRNHRDPSERHAAIAGWIEDWIDGRPPHNVWLGTSVENRKTVDERVPLLLALAAVVRFLSAEPLLEGIDLASCAPTTLDGDASNPSTTNAFTGMTHHPRTCLVAPPTEGTAAGVSWVIIGGESGHRPRPFNVAWAAEILAQCRTARVAAFVKQVGGRAFTKYDPGVRASRALNFDVPPIPEWEWRLAHSKGGDPAEWPEALRVFEFPKEAARA